MFKKIFETLVLLVVQPTKGWQMITNRKETHEEFLSQFIYPLIGICTLAAFIGELLGNGESNVQNALKEATIVLTSQFGGFYMAAFTNKQISTRWFSISGDFKYFQRYTGYAMAITFVITAILELMPDLFFIRIANLAVFYIIWSSVDNFVKVDDKKVIRFSTIITLAILLSPIIIEKILYTIMPGMRAN
ncbi:MAG: YIP1 family protein [Bacteroidales bacterium]|nr:YIP1 family protein [Bacteroidales bacterium]